MPIDPTQGKTRDSMVDAHPSTPIRSAPQRMKHKSLLPVGLTILTVLCLTPLAPAQQHGREWTSTDGRTITATLLNIDTEKNEVTLVRDDGAEFQIPIASLSLDDQAHIKENLARFTWIDIPAIAPDDANLNLALQSLLIPDTITIETDKRGRTSEIALTRSDPLGYRERHLCTYNEDIPIHTAIDKGGNLLILSYNTDPTRIYHINDQGKKSQIYTTPETEDSSIDTPVITDQSQIASLPDGGFFLRSRWKETYQENGRSVYTSRLDYFTMQFSNGRLRFTPHFSEDSVTMRTQLQTLEAFGGDRLIVYGTRGAQLGLFDIPPSSTRVSERSVSGPSDTTWTFDFHPLLVLSEHQIIADTNTSDFRIVFLLDLEAKTYSPLGPVATNEGEKATQLRYLAIAPDGTHLVYYKVSEQAFKQLEIPQPESSKSAFE